MESIGDVLKKTDLTGRKEYLSHAVFCHWDEIIGRNLAQHVRPVRLDFSRLYLSADAPVWANELRYMERSLIDKINAFACAELVKSIHYSIGQGRKGLSPAAVPEKAAPAGMPAPEDAEIRQARSACEGMADSEMKQAVAGALAQSLARRRGLKEDYHACAGCGASCPREHPLCADCERKERQAFRASVRRLLQQQPWLKYHQIYQINRAPADIVRDERLRLMQEIAGRMESGEARGAETEYFVMLATGAPPDGLTDALIEKTLKRYRFDLRPPSGNTGNKGRKRILRRRS